MIITELVLVHTERYLTPFTRWLTLNDNSFSAIVHCFHPLILPTAICCLSSTAKKSKKEGF